jgi:hypothetical protein
LSMKKALSLPVPSKNIICCVLTSTFFYMLLMVFCGDSLL